MKQKILIVDDEQAIQKLLSLSLGAGNYATMQALNGNDGLLLASNNTPQLILLDLALPDMDGSEFLKRLREWSAIPVIILSSRDNEGTKINLL